LQVDRTSVEAEAAFAIAGRPCYPEAIVKARVRKTTPFTVAVVLILTLGSLIAGSHCYLGGMKVVHPSEHACCAKPAQTRAPAPLSNYAECCASLAAPLPAHSSAPALRLHELFAAWPPLLDVFAIPSEITPSPVARSAQVPPDPPPLYELVLSHSLPAHAPPSPLV
jgi:hypothetical protein